MIEVGNEFVVAPEDAGLDIAPSMGSSSGNAWAGSVGAGSVGPDALRV